MAHPLLASLLDLLFPPRCAGCGQSGSWLCSACLAEISWIRPPICPLCGEGLTGEGRCPRMEHHPELLDGLRSAAWHAGPLRFALHRLKYRGQRVLADPVGAILVQGWRREPFPADVVIPVPLHPARLRERGYNQAALLARRLCMAVGLPLDERSLRRIRQTPPQVDLRAAERRQNVRGAFSYTGPPLEGRAICLIDDICTTGATLEACAAALREAGAAQVWAYTVARPRYHPAPPPGSDR
ncbi:MAG: ComF family protein [Anaerolineae bacterium]|nr:ComF family protein [Anaerolineae bacterium]